MFLGLKAAVFFMFFSVWIHNFLQVEDLGCCFYGVLDNGMPDVAALGKCLGHQHFYGFNIV